MPFTFAHPAIILPLRNLSSRWFSGIALIAGSITPDFEYFLRMRIHSSCSHSIEGILTFNIPIGIILILLYLFLVQKPLLEALPASISSRIPLISTDRAYLLKRIPVFFISLLIGIGSHLLWDAFTHTHGYFTERVSWLHESHALIGFKIPGFKIVQHLSTLLGLLFVGIYFIKLPKVHSHEHRWPFRFFTVVIFTAITVFILRFLLEPQLIAIGHIIATAISASIIGILVASFLRLMRQN